MENAYCFKHKEVIEPITLIGNIDGAALAIERQNHADTEYIRSKTSKALEIVMKAIKEK